MLRSSQLWLFNFLLRSVVGSLSKFSMRALLALLFKPSPGGRSECDKHKLSLGGVEDETVVPALLYSSSSGIGVQDLSGLKRSIFLNSSRVFSPKSLS